MIGAVALMMEATRVASLYEEYQVTAGFDSLSHHSGAASLHRCEGLPSRQSRQVGESGALQLRNACIV